MAEHDDGVHVTTTLKLELRSDVQVDEKRYVVMTENADASGQTIVSSRVFLDAAPVLSRKFEYGSKIGGMDVSGIERVVKRHHAETIESIRDGKMIVGKKPPDLLEDAKVFLRKRANRKALGVLRDAHGIYPDDPFVMSLYGSLLATVDKNYTDGIKLCKRAIELLHIKMPQGGREHYLAFYQNLSRACLASGDKQAAVDAIYKGMPYDREDGPMHKELVKLGVRRDPPLPFLGRSNPLNVFLGRIRHLFLGKKK